VTKEVAVGTGMQYQAQGNEDRHQRWDRIERAALGERDGKQQAQGLSQRQAAKMLDVPRSTLQAWRAYHERLDASPVVVAFFRSVAGLAFLHRLVVALHLVYTEVGACGIRLVCLFLRITGLDRFVGAFPGTTPPVVTSHLPASPHDGCTSASRSTMTSPNSAAFRFTWRRTRSRYAVSYAASPCATYVVPCFNRA
jgi:Flp pilus assembly protein TadB